ncbi:putative exported protein [Salmonella enterica subsp. enterica]|uniref:Putative exported protein n=1 Tax=Salmonella enterica I TaxID=59201 RepID=A0A379WKG8_SALET|nr:putative exported protein [Salmonella enterica subsp. enterica]
MPNKPFTVKVTDSKGAVIVQKEMQSYRNGFIGVWLPRNMEGTLRSKLQR